MKPKILLIDDDVQNSTILCSYLDAEGFNTVYARDGEDGLKMYEEERPDLILLDINMPGINGFEVAQRIRRNDRRVIIFFLTDRTEKADRLRGFELKGNDYIPKPFYPEELVAKINERFDSLTVKAVKDYRIGNTVFSPNLSLLTYNGESHNLSTRQCEILQLLVENIGNVVERDVILSQVWGDTSYANSLALNVQITYIRKLIADPTISINTIKRRGYMISEDSNTQSIVLP
ncbi:MAG: response regulator transcription factor [Muribaculaceae bacterium]|nr:response regulator transcription factor [Muribaculaceae bacterium]